MKQRHLREAADLSETAHPGKEWKAARSAAIVTLLLLVALGSCFQFLTLSAIPASPANDLAKHAAAILNFKSAFLDGQWLPRIQLPPAGYPDFPLFQFYSTLLGYLSLPFLLAGLSPLVALTLGIVVIRWVAGIALFATGRISGASRAASLAGAISYTLTPYILSNFYGRIAMPESTAHGVLPILFYGLVRMHFAPDRWAVAFVLVGVVGLAIAHPIFLLYGTAAAGLFIVIAFPTRRAIGAMLVLIGALMLAAFQWLPAFAGRGSFAADFLYGSPYYARRFSSLRGLFAQPLSLVEEGRWSDGAKLYLTPGVLTVPVMLFLLFKLRNRLAAAILVLLCGFLLLSFPPFDIWQLFPEFTWSVQFPYRLIAFVAFFVAIGLMLVLPRMNWLTCAAIVALLIGQNYRLLSELSYSESLPVEPSKIADTFINLDYLSIAQPPLIGVDGNLRHFTQPVGRHFMVDASDVLLPGNYFALPKRQIKQNLVRIRGSILATAPVDFWISEERTRDVAIDGVRRLEPGAFTATFAVPDAQLVLSANVRTSSESDVATARIVVTAVDRIPGNAIEVAPGGTVARRLYLSGTTIPADQPVTLWIANPTDPATALTSKITVGPGHFRTTLTLPIEGGTYMLIRSSPDAPTDLDDAKVSANISDYLVLDDGESPTTLIRGTDVVRTEVSGYRRGFAVNPDAIVPPGTAVRIELPLAFSPLYQISQHGEPLRSVPDFRGLTQILSKTPHEPIIAKFRMPWSVWFLMATGGLTCLLGWRTLRRTVDLTTGGSAP